MMGPDARAVNAAFGKRCLGLEFAFFFKIRTPEVNTQIDSVSGRTQAGRARLTLPVQNPLYAQRTIVDTGAVVRCGSSTRIGLCCDRSALSINFGANDNSREQEQDQFESNRRCFQEMPLVRRGGEL